MAAPPILPIFDGHNDTLLALRGFRPEQRSARSFFERSDQGHLDLPRAHEGGFGGGFFAVFIPSPPAATGDEGSDLTITATGYEVRMAPPLEHAYALRATLAVIADLFRMEAESGGQLRVVRTASELARCLADGVLAMVLHLEGAEAIDPELDALEVFYHAGLRSVGIVWSRPNAFGYGVPFRYPSSPDTGPGLTAAGRDLVRACNRLGIMLDLSHLNEQGFWDVARLSAAPLVATHSNAHALCPITRNLTDRQLDAIKESDGLVGVAFEVSMLRADGDRNVDTPLEIVVQHIDYLAERMGIDRVGLGSDFDGATMPRALSDVSKLPHLIAALRKHGYDERAVRKVTHDNWIRVLRQTWRD